MNKASLSPQDTTITGARETGLDDLTREGGLLVSDLRVAIQNVNTTITKLNEQALSASNLENLKASIDHLSSTTLALAESSKKIDDVLGKAGDTMGSAKKAADDIQVAINDARKTIQAATKVMEDASHGKGMLATMLNNQELANDLKALVGNLRAHGVLFYRDSAAKTEAPASQPQRTPAQQRKSGRP